MRRAYLTAKRLALLEQTLTPRDTAIIESLDRLRVATTEQLKRLHFADLTARSAARQAPKALARLAESRIVTKLERQLGGTRAGSRAAVWSLDVAGQRLAAACGPAGGRIIRRPWTPSLSFLAHRLAVSECFVLLTEHARTGACDVLDFDAEPLSWRRYASAYGGTFILKPDAFCGSPSATSSGAPSSRSISPPRDRRPSRGSSAPTASTGRQAASRSVGATSPASPLPSRPRSGRRRSSTSSPPSPRSLGRSGRLSWRAT